MSSRVTAKPYARQHNRVYRPWGWYQGLNRGDRYQVKCIMVERRVLDLGRRSGFRVRRVFRCH